MIRSKVLIALLSTYERGGWFCKELVEFIYSLSLSDIGYATAIVFTHNFVPAAAARNTVARQFKDSEADWLCMLDNDMVPPLNLLDTLKDAPSDAGIIAPIFHLWDQTKGVVGMCWGVEGKDTGNFGPGFHEITKCGTGAIFIKREVFNRVPPPWFRYIYNADGGVRGTEDIAFCTKAREHGVKIYGNADIWVGHYHSTNLLTLATKFKRLNGG